MLSVEPLRAVCFFWFQRTHFKQAGMPAAPMFSMLHSSVVCGVLVVYPRFNVAQLHDSLNSIEVGMAGSWHGGKD